MLQNALAGSVADRLRQVIEEKKQAKYSFEAALKTLSQQIRELETIANGELPISTNGSTKGPKSETGRRIYELLQREALRAKEIVEKLGLDKQVVGYHLQQMKKQRLVKSHGGRTNMMYHAIGFTQQA